MLRDFRRSKSNGSLPTKRLAVMALFAIAAPLAIMQLVLLAKVNVGTMNINVTDYLPQQQQQQDSLVKENDKEHVSKLSHKDVSLSRRQRQEQPPPKHHYQDQERRRQDSQEILSLSSIISNDSFQPSDKTITSSRKLFAEIPDSQRKTFYIPCGKACHPMIRALRVMGWTRVNSMQEAVFIFDHEADSSVPKKMESWQRYNKLMSYSKFYKFWEICHSMLQNLPFVLTTYRLPGQFVKFQQHLTPEREEWVLEDYDEDEVKVLQLSNSKEDSSRFEQKKGTIQKSICNAMTWNGRKMNLKVFWFVASTDPLLVFYMDGWANILGRTEKDAIEEERTDVPFDDLQVMLEEQYKGKSIQDPMMHVRKQMKQALGQVAEVFNSKRETFKTKAQDSFEVFTADFVIDEDLNVWLSNIQQELELGEDYYFRLDLNHNLHFGLASILQEVWEKQEKGLPLLPVKNNGPWELVYANGWTFDYEEYKRLPTEKKNDETCTPKPEAT